MSTEKLLFSATSVDFINSEPNSPPRFTEVPMCLMQASNVADGTHFSKLVFVEDGSVDTRLHQFISNLSSEQTSDPVHVNVNSQELSESIIIEKPLVTCSRYEKSHYTEVAHSTAVTKLQSDWIFWRNSIVSMFCVFCVFFVAVDLYYLLNPELYVQQQINSRYALQKQSETASFNGLTPPKISCTLKKRHNMTRRDMLLHEQILHHSPSGFMSSHSFSLQRKLKSANSDKDFLNYAENIQLMVTTPIKGKGVMIIHGLQDVPIKESKTVTERIQNMKFVLSPAVGLELHLELTNVRLLPEYTDVSYEHSDNGIVLDTSRRSNMHHWRAPLQNILNNWCRHPLPTQYYLTMHPYLDRHTTAKRQSCVSPSAVGYRYSKQPWCPSGVPHKSSYFHRSINGQCTQNKASFLPPQRNSFYCTANTPLVNTIFEERITERQSYLKDAHCDTQRRLCQTCLRRSCWRDNTKQTASSDGWDQALADDLAHKWELLGDAKADGKGAKGEQCCGVDCYSIPSCLDYFSSACQEYTIHSQHIQEVCLQGKTLKFTLNPEFDFANGSFMCHLTHYPPKHLYAIKTWLALNGSWETDVSSYVVSLDYLLASKEGAIDKMSQRMEQLRNRKADSLLKQNLQGSVLLWDEKLRVEHHSPAKLWKELILKRKPASDQFSVYKLKSFGDFGSKLPEFQKHREEKYATVQFTTPFFYNTERWGNESCQVNISHMHKSQPLYDQSSQIPVVLASPTVKMETKSFRYTFAGPELNPTIQITMETGKNYSLLRSALCAQRLRLSAVENTITNNQTDRVPRHSGAIINQVGMGLKATAKLISTAEDSDRCERIETWQISIEGWVTGKPTFLDIRVEKQKIPVGNPNNLESNRGVLIIKEDVLLLPDLEDFRDLSRAHHPFILEFDLVKITKGQHWSYRSYALHIYLRDCVQQYHLQTVLGDEYMNPPAFRRTAELLVPVFTDQSTRMWKLERLYLPFLFVCTITGIVYLVLLLAYAVVRVCTNHSKHPIGASRHHAQRTAPSISVSSSTSLLSGTTMRIQELEPMTTTRKVLIMVYLCFRVFYTFLFTISVGLSLILSIESNAARDFTAAIHSYTVQGPLIQINGRLPTNTLPYVVTSTDGNNRWWESNSWMFEAARMEDFAHSELLRQTQSMNNQIADCGERFRLSSLKLADMMLLLGGQIRDWLNPRCEVINLKRFLTPKSGGIPTEKSSVNSHDPNNTWTTNAIDASFFPIHRSTWKLLEEANWLPYLDMVDEHLRKIRDGLDTEVIDRWTPFDRLLNNLLVNNWIAPARRSMNTSWSRLSNLPAGETGLFSTTDAEYYDENMDNVTSDPMNQKRLKEARALKLANFIGVPQPAHARLSGARIWNSFRSQVPSLPNHFHFDIGRLLETNGGGMHGSKWSSTRYYDKRYMLSNEDWQHISGGFLESSQRTVQRHIQHVQSGRYAFQRRVHTTSSSISHTSGNYFLSLTQVRLLLLLLDAVIILARCCQTYRFMQRFWFGDIKRVNVDAFYTEQHVPVNSPNESKGTVVMNSSDMTEMRNSTTTDRRTLPWQDFDGYAPHNRDSGVPILSMDSHQSRIQPSDSARYGQLNSTSSFSRAGHQPQLRMRGRSEDFGYYVDGSQGRLTACYCCMDAHYLLVIVGIGLLILGFVLLWTTDRHVRTGWLLARTGVIVRSGALEDCRMRTNAILKHVQTNYWNKQVKFIARETARKEAHRLGQMIRRIQHERIQLYQGYLSELCTIDRKRQHLIISSRKPVVHSSSGYTSPIEVIPLSEPKVCLLFDTTGRLKATVKSQLNEQFLSPGVQPTNQQAEHNFPQIPACVFTPIVPATYAEGRSSRILRLTKTRDAFFRSNSSFSAVANGTKILRPKTDKKLPEELDLSLSMGSLGSLLSACQRLILTGLTVVLAMGGFLACLQLAKLLAQRLVPIQTRKVLVVTYSPVQPIQSTSLYRT